MITYTVTGVAELQAKVSQDITPHVKAMTLAIANEVQGRVAPYAPPSEANVPVTAWTPGGRKMWYERGFGSRWIRKDGTLNYRKSSEMMDRRWAITPVGATAHKLGNTASYSNWVHASGDQVEFHKRRGWKTDRTALVETIASGAITTHWMSMWRAVMR